MSTYTVVSTSGKSITVYESIDQFEGAHRRLLDRCEELEERVRTLAKEREDLSKALAEYVKEERP